MAHPQSSHPYYPTSIVLPDYAPNTASTALLIAGLGLVVGSALWIGQSVAERWQPLYLNASRLDRALFSWFLLCGLLHCGFESQFLLQHSTLAASSSTVAQLWKEYALADSRYMTSDPFTLCVEGITVAVWGPLSMATAAAVVRWPHGSTRHLLQIVVSVAHLYGVALYFGTAVLELWLRDVRYWRPEPVYVWVYLIGFNVPWAVVPAFALCSSVQAVRRVFAMETVQQAPKRA